MLRLIKQNPAFRTLPKWLAISGLTAALVINVLSIHLWRQNDSTDLLQVVLVVWLAATLYMVFGEVRTRCGPFDIALPISARKVWFSHISAVVLAGVAIIAATTALIGGGLWILWKLSGSWMVSTRGMGGMALNLVAGLILAVVLLQNPVPADCRVPRTRVRTVAALAVMAAVLALVIGLSRLPAWAAVIPLSIAAALGWYRYLSVPRVFDLAGESVGAEDFGQGAVKQQWEAAGAVKIVGGLAFGRFLNRTIQNCFLEGVKAKQSPWLTFPFVFGFGLLISGFDGRWIEDSMRFNYIWMTAYTLFAFTMYPPKQIYLLDGLPVSRRRLLNVMIIPHFIVLLAGYAGGGIALGYLDRNHPKPLEVIHMVQDSESGHYYLYVPYRILHVTLDEHIPETVSPWGEAHEGWSYPLLPGGLLKMYSPYSTPLGSSIDFAAWQMSRAVEAVYGATIQPDELASRYLREKTDGGAELIEKRLTISTDYPDLRPLRKAGPVFPVVAGLTFALWMLGLAVYFQAFRAGVSNSARTVLAFGVMGFFMAGWLAVLFGPIVKVLHSGRHNGGLTALLARAEGSPVATAAVWIGMAILCVAAYRVALWRLGKSEAVREKKAMPV
jgi:hypothetical protein